MFDAVILAGGRGTRLASVVPEWPKPMAPVCGKPFLELLLGALESKGLKRAVLSVGYRAETISGHFGSRFRGVELDYEVEHEPLGTGGAIRRSLARCRGDAALVVNGDTLLDLELGALHEHWLATRRPTLVACEVPDTTRYGRVVVEGQRLVAFTEKGTAGPGWINSGHYVLPRDFLEGRGLPEAFSFENEVLAPQMAELGLAVFFSRGSFIDIGVPEDYARAQTELQRWA